MLFKRVYISSILFFLGFNCFSQDSLRLHIKSINNNEPIENAAVINQSNKAFGYTNSEGKYDLTDFNLKDSLIVVIPGYESYRILVSKIVKENGIIHLVPKFEQLDEVILLGKDENISSCQYNTRSKKKYYTSLMSSGASILSLHKQKKCGNCKLAAVSFQFDNSKLDPNEEVFIRPIVKKISENGEWMDLIETPYSILLNNKTSKIIISLKSSNVNFHEDNDYLVGFEVINRTNKEKVLSFQATTMKGAKTFLRKNPTSEWFDLGKSTNFSLDYELFFSGCL